MTGDINSRCVCCYQTREMRWDGATVLQCLSVFMIFMICLRVTPPRVIKSLLRCCCYVLWSSCQALKWNKYGDGVLCRLSVLILSRYYSELISERMWKFKKYLEWNWNRSRVKIIEICHISLVYFNDPSPPVIWSPDFVIKTPEFLD